MIPFLNERLLALGPWLAPALLIGLAAVTLAAAWLIENGLHKRSWWQLALGVGLAGYLVAVAGAAAGVIQ